MKHLPLEGIKVIDAASFIAAPVVSALMSDYGAEVIKIEPPSGDVFRGVQVGGPVWPDSDFDWGFILENRNKRSLSIDLKTLHGQNILKKLVKKADVLVTNLPKTPRAKLGLNEDNIRSINSRIIYASLTAYGENGPDSDRTALDATAWWAGSGMMEWSKPDAAGGLPPFPVPGAGDHPTGIALFSAILLALMNREKTGVGTAVNTSLLANGIWSNSVLTQAILSGHQPLDSWYWNEWSALRNLYPLKDKSIFFLLLINEEKHWKIFLECMDLEHVGSDDRFYDRNSRQENRQSLKMILQEKFKDLSFEEAKERLLPTGIVFNKVITTTEVINGPQTNANGMFMDIDGESKKNLKLVAPPMNIENSPRKKATKAPQLGEHSIEILQEIGYSEKEIDDLKKKKIIF